MEAIADTTRIPEGVALEEIPCPFGCAAPDDFVLSGRDRLHGRPGEFRVVRCRRCGLMRTSPRPTLATIGRYYPEEYGPFHVPVIPERERRGPRPVKPLTLRRRLLRPLRAFKHRILSHDSQEIPALPAGRLLEVGCASGAFLRRMSVAGWTVEAIEPSEDVARRVRELGFAVRSGSIEMAPETDFRYDLIAGWMVLEHLHDPISALTRLRGWVRPDGWLALSVPDAGSIEFRLLGSDWYALQLPTHLFHYTPRTLRAMLATTGWRVERIFWHRNPKNLLVSLHWRCQDRGHPRLARLLLDAGENRRLRRPRSYLGLVLGLLRASGRMTVWARPA